MKQWKGKKRILNRMLDHSCTSLMVQLIDLFGKKNYFLFSKQFCRDIVRHTDAGRYYIPLRVMFSLTYY